MAWTIDYAATATKALRKLDATTTKRIVEYMEHYVASLPDPKLVGKPLAGPWKGYWRYRVGDYRILCSIDDGHLRILVAEIGHRREVYR